MKPSRRGRRSQKQDRFTVTSYTDKRGNTERELWRVTGYDLDGQRIRKTFPTYGEAAAERDRLNVSRERQELSLAMRQTSLTEPQLRECERAVVILGEHSIIRAAEFFIRNYRESQTKITVRDAYKRFMDELSGAGRRDRTLENLRVRVGHLVDDFGDVMVHEITSDNIAHVINEPRGRHKTRSLRSKRNERLALRRFFGWCESKCYCQSNPVLGTVNPDPTDEEREPHVLTSAEASKLMAFAAEYNGAAMLPYITLALFAAVRPNELGRLGWGDIDLKEGALHISKQASKTKQERLVALPKNAVEWLRLVADSKPPIRPTGHKRMFLACIDAIGYGTGGKAWQPDTLRHTAASFYAALTQDEGRTATWCGHSVSVLRKHYRRLIGERKELRQFWNIRPAGVKSGKVVVLKKVG